MKFKVGDNVRVRKDLVINKRYFMEDNDLSDTVVSDMLEFAGKIVKITRADGKYFVKGCRYCWTDEMFDTGNEQKIVITTDGKETLARLYEGDKVVKRATANCSPDDTFDFKVGAKLAYERLMEEKPAEPTRRPTVGDKVRVIGGWLLGHEEGEIATIIQDDHSTCPYRVQFENGDKTWKHSFNVELVTDTTTVEVKKFKVGDRIFAEDNIGQFPGGAWGTVVEVLDKRHHHEDYVVEFDAGLNLYSHVMPNPTKHIEPTKPTYYNGKVVCVAKEYKSSTPLPDFTVGKIYDVVDGRVTDDSGWKSPRYTNIEDMCRCLGNTFIPVVE